MGCGPREVASCWLSRTRDVGVGARHRSGQRKRRLRQIDHRDARRRRADECRTARRHHRSRLPPEELHPLHRQPARLGQARAGRPQGSAAFLRRARLDAQARRERADRVFRLRRSRDGGRAVARLHRRRYARHRQLSDAAGAFDGRHADHPAQRQLRRLRRARHRRRRQLRGHRRKSLRRDGARRAPSAAAGRRHPDGLDRGAQPALDARLAQQAPGRRGLAGARATGSAFAPSTALPSGRSIASSFRAA